MAEAFLRLFSRTEPAVLSMNVQAALGPARPPKRTQFSLLVRHFLERFFNHETASPDGDAKARLMLIALTTGLPGFVVALYLWPEYHSFIPYARNDHIVWFPGPPPYWAQVNQHFFYVVYSFVAMGIATIFEWDLFFPDLLDMNVLGSLPIANTRVFAARVTAIAVLIAGFLFDANILASLVLPAAIDPPNSSRFLAGHILAVLGSGLFAAVFVVALQAVSLAVLGERLFRRLSLVVQSFGIAVLLLLLLLFPVLSSVTPVILKSGSVFVLCCPPFWFLGIYQRLMEGPAAMPIFGKLAQIGCMALLATVGLAVLAYPLAYLRKVRQIVVGAPARTSRSGFLHFWNSLLHATLVRPPVRRAVHHFIAQTLVRVPRYRIYLALYGGVGLSVVTATILRFGVVNHAIRVEVSADGIRATVGIVVFWMVAGIRMAFFSSGNQRGRWIFRVLHGNPPALSTAMEQFASTKTWVLLWAVPAALAACFGLRAISPAQLASWQATGSQVLLGLGLCILLTDAFFLNVTSVPFTSEQSGEEPNLAMTALKYFTFFPLVAALPLRLEPWIQESAAHAAIFTAAVVAIHLLLEQRHRAILRLHCSQIPLEEDEEDFPMKLGLRY
jgi:hypothetical protein